MPEFSGPWPQQTTFSLDAFRRHFRQAQRSGVVSGLAVTAGTGSQVVISGGQAYVDGMMYRSSNDPTPAAVTLTAPQNSATNPRRDMVVLRLDPSDTTGGTQGSIRAAIVQGIPAASPVDPTPTQTDTGVWEMPLAAWTMPAKPAAQNPAAITDLRSVIGAERFGLFTGSTNGSGDVVINHGLGVKPKFATAQPSSAGVPNMRSLGCVCVVGDMDASVMYVRVMRNDTQPTSAFTSNPVEMFWRVES